MANKTDFSMIWGSNAPDKYEFTPENYMTGWHFVGSVPPSRTMFDSWMRMQDEKSQYLHDIMSDAFGTTSPGGMAIDDTKVPTSDKNNLITLLSNLANVEKGIIGGTSWRDNPAITLATMSAFVQQLAAGSDVEWSGNTWKNKKLGMTGLSAQNGYISLGLNFGGQIIQWGRCSGTSDKQDQWFQPFPLSVSECFSVLLTRHGGNSVTYIVRIVSVVNNGFYWTDASYVTGTHGSGDPNLWIAICR